MDRRKFILGAGALASGSTAIVGTGAFTQIEADRTVTGSVSKDSQAILQLRADKTGLQNEELATYDGNGEIVLNLSNLNPDSKTTLGGIFEIINTTGEKVYVYIKDETGYDDRITFFKDDPPANPPASIEGPTNAVELKTGGIGKLVVGVQLDLNGKGQGFTFDTNDNFTIVASTQQP